VQVGSAAFDEQQDHGVAFVLDLTERKLAEGRKQGKANGLRETQLSSRTPTASRRWAN